MKPWWPVAVGALIGFALTMPAFASSDPTKALVKVNNEPILQRDVDFVVNSFFLPQFAADNPGQEVPADEKQRVEQTVLDQMISERLIVQAAKQLAVQIDAEMLTQQVETLTTQFPKVPQDALRKFLGEKLLIQTFLQTQVAATVTVTEEDVRKAYDQRKSEFNEPEMIRARHILVKVEPGASPEQKAAARKKIEGLLAEVQAGKDFAELAKHASDCPTNEKGGDLGFFPRNVMVKPFEEAAFQLQDGQVSGVVETDFGYHLITVTEHKASRTVTFDVVKERLRQDLTYQKSQAEIGQWISDARMKANIEYVGP